MNLTYAEKSGLQIFRNYTRAFENHNIKIFRSSINNEKCNFDDLEKVTLLLVSEDIRFAPIILCGYADSVLKRAFMQALPNDVPGGRNSMLNGYGPLSTFSQRISLAHAFCVLSQDLMIQLDAVRKVRNRISHDWDLKSAETLLESALLEGLYPIEQEIAKKHSDISSAPEARERAFSLRTRLVWLAGRLTYEGAAFNRAKRAHLDPINALYGNGSTKWLAAIANICWSATRAVSSGAPNKPS